MNKELSVSFDWEKHGLGAHASQLDALTQALRSWNDRINLVSRKDAQNLEAHHILPCAVVAKVADFSTLSTYLDVGTGGGLPGLVLALLYPNLECTLLDSTAKKLRAVEAIAQELNLPNVSVLHTRIEEHRQRYDLVTGRAVTALPRFLTWVREVILPGKSAGGVYYWKGGPLEPELEQWGLRPHKMHALDALTGDEHLQDKYIAHFRTADILHNTTLKKLCRVE